MRGPLAALAAASVLLLLGGAAAAHANYVKSNPAADARLARPPTEVRVTFNEPADAKGSALVVADASGTRHDLRDVTLATDEPNTLRVTLGAIGDGGYLVSWTALSSVDGHETRGAFAFAVGDAPLLAIPDIGPSAPPPGPVELLGRALSFAGIAILIGLASFTTFIRPPGEEAERRRERRLVVMGAALVVLGSALLLAQQGPSGPQRFLALLGLRGLAGVGAAAALALPERAVPADARREIVGFCGLLAGLTATLVSHAAASGDLVYVALDYVHVVAISVWLGGVVALLTVALPSATAATQDRRRLGEAVWRFSLTALVAVAVIVATGVLQSLKRLVLLEDLVETPYGLALLAKVVLLLGLVVLGALSLFIWGPRLRRGIAARRPLARSVVGESALFAGVLIATSFLTALAPPAQASGGAFDETKRVSGVRVQLLVPSAIPGRNRYVVRVQRGLAPVSGAEKVALRFTMVEHDMGEQELVAAERAPGEYVAEGSPTAMFGTWRVETIVRLTGQADLHALFSVPIAQPAGQGATAKVIPVPPVTLIVFAEPFQPLAGAPITLNVVVVNETGDPVTGRQVRATFSGPAERSPIDAVEDAATSGPGRYRVAIPALEAGVWRVTIALSGAGSGVYELEVGR